MSKEEIFNMFKVMFSDWAEFATGYHKIGSRCIAITFDDGGHVCSRVFLYISADNWQFGTKLWRKRSLNAVRNKAIGMGLAQESDFSELANGIIQNEAEVKEEIISRLKDGGDQNEE